VFRKGRNDGSNFPGKSVGDLLAGVRERWGITKEKPPMTKGDSEEGSDDRGRRG